MRATSRTRASFKREKDRRKIVERVVLVAKAHIYLSILSSLIHPDMSSQNSSTYVVDLLLNCQGGALVHAMQESTSIFER
jgi:hypothetical protein